MNILVKDMPADRYYADPCDKPSLSQSMACDLALRSPAHAFAHHPKLGAEPRDDSPTSDWGTAIHSLLLSDGQGIGIVDAKNFRTDAAKELRDLYREHGKVPMVRGEYDTAVEVANRLRDKIRGFGYDLSTGDREITAIWETTTSDEKPVQCRGRLDFLSEDRCLILDLKTCSTARPDLLPRHMVTFGYDIQAYAYTQAIEIIRPELAGRVRFVFLFCETEPPYCVTPVRCAGSMRMLGDTRWQLAVDLWERCLRTGVWSDYVTETIEAEAPTWELNRWLAA